ncbi:MAG: HDOD domain-containing protein [Verrucomicrobiota bacterium]
MSAISSKLDQLASAIPSLPGVIHEVKKALSDFDNPLTTIEQVLNKDPAFAARVLKLANSAYHSFSFKISTISQALMMVGLSELRSLLMATSMIRVFKGIKNPGVNMTSFWRHSVACGICARQLAVKQRELNAEEYFMMGLMHDLGRLILFCSMPEKMEQACDMAKEKRISITDAELKVFSFNHADLSAQVLKEWKLPESLFEVVRMHHRPNPSSAHHRPALIIHIADIIVDSMALGDSGEGIIAPATDANLDVFQDAEATIAAVMDEVDAMLEELVRIFVS